MTPLAGPLKHILQSSRKTSHLATEADVLGALADDLGYAILLYRQRRGFQRFDRQDRDSARVFADTVARHLQALISTIERHQRAVTRPVTDGSKRAVQYGLVSSTPFAYMTRGWLRTMRQWQAAAAAAHQRQPPNPDGAPRDEQRLRLECRVGEALTHAGVSISMARAGVFVRVLEELVYPAAGIEGASGEAGARAAIGAEAEWRTLPMLERWPPRVTDTMKPAKKF